MHIKLINIMEIHYLMASECGGHLKRVVSGINDIINSTFQLNQDTDGGVLDMNF